MTSSPTQRHDVVTFALKKSEAISPECERHEEQKCEMLCEQCDSPVCMKCILSGAHENHKVPQISEIHSYRKELINRDTEELEISIAPVLKSVLSELEEMMPNVVQMHGERQNTIAESRGRCHALVDSVFNTYLSQSQQMETEDKESLQTLTSKFEELQSSVRSTINENHFIIASNDFSKFTNYASGIERFRIIPKRFQLTVPPFKPGELTEQCLFQLLGIIPSTIKTDILLGVQEQTSTGNQPKKRLMNKPEVILSLETNLNQTLRTHCIPNTDQFYVSGDIKIIKRMNTEGAPLEITTTPGLYPPALTVTNEGHLVHTDWVNKTINIQKNGKIEPLIRLQDWRPWAICSTSTDDLLVTMMADSNNRNKVVRYSGSTVAQEIQHSDTGESLYSGPHFITENKNLDIVVSDFKTKTVVVVNREGKFRFSYDGSIRAKKPFTPRGVTTDSMCHILIADPDNHVIHIIDHNGQFLQFVENIILRKPHDISTDSNDMLFVVEFETGLLKRIRYLI
jgi:hypothetical protein